MGLVLEAPREEESAFKVLFWLLEKVNV